MRRVDTPEIIHSPYLTELLERVLMGVQEHVQGAREDVVDATSALDQLRSAHDSRPDVDCNAQVVSDQLRSVIAHLGDIQLLLTAATQALVARNQANSYLNPEE